MATTNVKTAGRAGSGDRAPRTDEFAPVGDLTGTVVLISGGSRGLGRLLASAVGLAGATVALLARSRDGLDETVAEVERAGGKAAAVTTDITDEAATADLYTLRVRTAPA